MNLFGDDATSPEQPGAGAARGASAAGTLNEIFWFFFDREQLAFPDPYTDEKGNIMTASGELVMEGPKS